MAFEALAKAHTNACELDSDNYTINLAQGKPFSEVFSGLIFLPLTATGQYLEGIW